MGIFRKGSKAYSIFKYKCPRCMEGDLYPTKTFSFKKSFEMNEKCSECGQDFEPEPGFYFGAMFVSYIFMGFFCIAFLLLFHWVFDLGLMTSFGMLVATVAFFLVVIFRTSRSVWLAANVKTAKK